MWYGALDIKKVPDIKSIENSTSLSGATLVIFRKHFGVLLHYWNTFKFVINPLFTHNSK